MFNLNLNLINILGNEQVTLIDMLDARENRVIEQQKILTEYKMCLISFTLNIPGSVKSFPLTQKSFAEGKWLILSQLKRHNINVTYEKYNCSKTGYEAFFAVDNDPYYIKKLMLSIEDSSKLGRVFDIDVLKQNGEKISRNDINSDPRSCLLCSESAHVCARSKKHQAEELILKTIDIMSVYFNEKFANMCSSCACRSMMYEVCITPKPGLVDRDNNGSHKDMDIYTFIDSSAVLAPYFRDLVMTGIKFFSDEPQHLFQRIRYPGMIAEDQMFLVTNNINTHKGLIFSLGIICAALGYLYANNKEIDLDSILELSKLMTVKVSDDFSGINKENANTYGEKLYALHGITGIRGEAAQGFVSVKKYGLPVFKNLLQKGFSINDAGALTLLNLIANVKDTNIISRSDINTQNLVQQEIKKLIKFRKLENISMDDIKEIDNKFISLNLSPGGCADLLAITYMLYFLDNNKK